MSVYIITIQLFLLKIQQNTYYITKSQCLTLDKIQYKRCMILFDCVCLDQIIQMNLMSKSVQTQLYIMKHLSSELKTQNSNTSNEKL